MFLTRLFSPPPPQGLQEIQPQLQGKSPPPLPRPATASLWPFWPLSLSFSWSCSDLKSPFWGSAAPSSLVGFLWLFLPTPISFLPPRAAALAAEGTGCSVLRPQPPLSSPHLKTCLLDTGGGGRKGAGFPPGHEWTAAVAELPVQELGPPGTVVGPRGCTVSGCCRAHGEGGGRTLHSSSPPGEVKGRAGL